MVAINEPEKIGLEKKTETRLKIKISWEWSVWKWKSHMNEEDEEWLIAEPNWLTMKDATMDRKTNCCLPNTFVCCCTHSKPGDEGKGKILWS